MPRSTVYLSGMMLNNFKHHEYPLFTAEVFDVNDAFGHTMKGVRITEHFTHQMIHYEERETKTNDKLIDIKSGSQRPFIMTCMVVNSDIPTLLVKHMQDGGTKVPLAPMIS